MRPTSRETDRIEREYNRMMIAWILVIALVSVAWMFFVFYPTPVGQSLMEYEEAYALGPTDLCSGDVLDYEITIHVRGPGVFNIDTNVWSMNPLAPVVMDPVRRIVVTESTRYELHRQWVVPPTMRDATTDRQVPWVAGQYERRYAMSTASRATTPNIKAIPFQIREDCNAK